MCVCVCVSVYIYIYIYIFGKADKNPVDILAIWVMQNSLLGVSHFLKARQFHLQDTSLLDVITQKRTLYVFYRDVEFYTFYGMLW